MDCPICNTQNIKSDGCEFVNIECSFCGKFAYAESFKEDGFEDNETKYDKEKLASYLFFNAKKDLHYYFIGNKNKYNLSKEKNKEFLPHSIYLSPEEVENWYPKTFEEKINLILLYFDKKSLFHGYYIDLLDSELQFLCFAEKESGSEEVNNHIDFILHYMTNEKLLYIDAHGYLLLPKAYSIIYELQKNLANNKNVFIAMSFAPQYTYIKEAIKKAIFECGYIPNVINEKDHNNFIMNEIYYEIKQSKFVIVDITGQNNGAYYESGYAEALGKPVIHTCNKDDFKNVHFDVKQKSTILWETEKQLIEDLKKRIKVTVGLIK